MITKLTISGNDLIDQPYDGVDRYILNGELRTAPAKSPPCSTASWN